MTFESPEDSSGVGQKIRSHARFWRSAGHEVHHFVLRRRNDNPQAPCITYLFNDTSGGKPTLAAWRSNGRIREALSAWTPDLVYMRQLLWWPGAVRACHVAPLVIEFNSIALHEYRQQSMLKYRLDSFSRSFFPRVARAIVSVTAEIDRTVKAGPALRAVIGNGYDVKAIVPRPPPNNVRPQLLFVGSPNQAWHGVDKLRALAGLLADCDFHIVVPGYTESGPPNFICHGALYGESLTALYYNTDVAFGTLALHRKQMEQATPLKVREYLAHGIPVIIGYDDPDLHNTDYCLRIPNTETNVIEAAPRIRRYIADWQRRAPDRADVVGRLDHEIKEATRLALFGRVVRNGR
ncbi:glycosyltransferase [Bordetella genomosp. 7]|uniref:glycosyltransferase n=1 Tax=Bordetella genomosp. 7 TaxID=1416805 RepID=UPI0020168F24|nr:glycosyltransferase [Bordetella genomosp. 7]